MTADSVVNQQHNPYEGMSEDDPNFVFKVHYERYHDLIYNLPEGWKKGDPMKNQAPYIHEDGTTSYKNPNMKKIKAFMREMDDLKRKQQEEEMEKENEANGFNAQGSPTSSSSWRNHPQRSMIKKLRLMLSKAGAPLEVVERRAAVEGIDMSLVLQPDEDMKENETDDKHKAFHEKPETPVHLPAPAPAILLKKYKRMIKMGVPLPQVQQLASIEANLTAEQVIEHCTETNESTTFKDHSNSINDSSAVLGVKSEERKSSGHHRRTHQSQEDTFEQLKKMSKAGVPLAALESTARMAGIDKEDLAKILGGVSVGSDGNEVPSATAVTSKADVPFWSEGLQHVSFDASSDLASLVRKLVQTVQKSSRLNTTSSKGKKKGDMVIDTLTLYHALGSFQGVQVARDRYNSTTTNIHVNSSSGHMEVGYLRSQRDAFVEMARSIGLTLPQDMVTTVDIYGLDNLVNFIRQRFKSEIDQLEALICDGFYDFESLGAMYPPGSRVLVKNAGGGGVDTIARVSWNRYEQGRTILGQPMKYFKLCLEYVVAVDSTAATFCEVVEGMEQFDGKRSLTGGLLQFVPFSAFSMEHQEALIERYRRRGQLYNRVALNVKDDTGESRPSDTDKSYSYMSYQKGCFFAKRSSSGGTGLSGANSTAALATEGRIIVDTRGASDWGHSLSIGYDPMVTGIHYKMKEYKLQMRSQAVDQAKGDKSGGTSIDERGGMILFDRVPEDYLELTWPLVVGFSLTAKTWGDCLVDGLDDITFQPDVFDRLVLPPSRKRLVQALVKNTGSDGETAFHDLIGGKGEGTVFLLHGPPGVGKTLTAEATAEVLRRPLYALSMGCMGTTADELERRLSDILKLSAKWDAIILLDEADSFLETRSSSSSLEKNAMVSVMLKLVEYFTGILFMTSNRLDSIDPAFKTRITLALKYDHLDINAREQIWNNLLLSSGIGAEKCSIDTKILASSFVLNGREIKNALRLALALAAEDGLTVPTHAMLMDTSAMVGPYQDEDVSNTTTDKCSLFPWWK